jgi:hypothetical protein
MAPPSSPLRLYGSIHDASGQDVAMVYAEDVQPTTTAALFKSAQLNVVIVPGEQFCVTAGKEGEGITVIGDLTVTGER